jgi:CheY-like chemotaxis protein
LLRGEKRSTTMASTVLVVEDDPDCREVLSEFLALRGYGVAQAANGEEALEQLRDQDLQPSLILLDLSLPVMSGWEFRERQVRDSKLVDIPVVVVSALPDALDWEWEHDSLEVDGYLEKPLDFHKLTALLDRFYRFS